MSIPTVLSLTSYQWCSPEIVNIITFICILLILSCFHRFPVTAMELLWCMVFCHSCRDVVLELNDLSSLGSVFYSFVHKRTHEHYPIKLIIGCKRAGREKRRKHGKGNKKGGQRKNVSHFLRFSIGKLAHETAGRVHLEEASCCSFICIRWQSLSLLEEGC